MIPVAQHVFFGDPPKHREGRRIGRSRFELTPEMLERFLSTLDDNERILLSKKSFPKKFIISRLLFGKPRA